MGGARGEWTQGQGMAANGPKKNLFSTILWYFAGQKRVVDFGYKNQKKYAEFMKRGKARVGGEIRVGNHIHFNF